MDADRDTLAADLSPFVTAVEAGVSSIMTAHVAYPALDPERRPATLSPPIVQGLLREELGFDGLVVTDALIMAGVTEGLDEGTAAVRAVAAGVDALLYPDDLEAAVEAVEAAMGDGLRGERVEEAVARVERMAESSAGEGPAGWGAEEDLRWALETATRSLDWYRGAAPDVPERIRLVTVDDDVGGPYPPPSRGALARGLKERGWSVEEVEVAARGGVGPDRGAGSSTLNGGLNGGDRTTIVALYADIRAWKGRPGLSKEAVRRLAELGAADARAVALFGHPRLVTEIPGDVPVLCAWGGESLMQQAAARVLASGG